MKDHYSSQGQRKAKRIRGFPEETGCGNRGNMSLGVEEEGEEKFLNREL